MSTRSTCPCSTPQDSYYELCRQVEPGGKRNGTPTNIVTRTRAVTRDRGSKYDPVCRPRLCLDTSHTSSFVVATHLNLTCRDSFLPTVPRKEKGILHVFRRYDAHDLTTRHRPYHPGIFSSSLLSGEEYGGSTRSPHERYPFLTSGRRHP